MFGLAPRLGIGWKGERTAAEYAAHVNAEQKVSYEPRPSWLKPLEKLEAKLEVFSSLGSSLGSSDLSG